jgi:phosphopantothenoylcysteine decarboxylase/phosphopantothenate--cysteine ligase
VAKGKVIGMRILVTAGPTREFLDPVRFLSNRSTGKMGYAVAEAALQAGHAVVLISGPVALPPPAGARVVAVVSAQEMHDAVVAEAPAADALVMTAAVADWRPVTQASQKLKKGTMDASLALTRTPDILMALAALGLPRYRVGFAAETEAVLASARGKLDRKQLDLVVANDVSRSDAGFAVDTNRVTFVTAAGDESLPLLTKREVAERLIDHLESALTSLA